MQRVIHEQLDRWKKSTKRKPLIIQGARQVGKTWLMKEFGKRSFENVCYINFENSERLRTLFTQDYNIERIIGALQVEVGFTIEAKNTLLIFDEIQEADRGLTALKYFHEKAPEYFVVAAGSLLGVAMQKKHSFPVGKVDFIQLHPFSFEEFLASTGNKKLSELLLTQDYNVLNTFHQELVQQLRLYYFIGGMPEAIAVYNENKNMNEVRNIQKNILVGYENDFAKYAPSVLVPRLRLVWQNIIGQLAKENKKFIYGQLKNGARAKDFDLAIAWLKDAGLIFKVPWLTKPTIPLISYSDMDIFKLFGLDVGLLGAMADIDPKILLNKNDVMTEFKGAFSEQFICQQFRVHEINSIYYWSAERGTAEIDFVLQIKNTVIPIEVKAEENLQAKSLKVYMEKFNPQIAVRSSLSEYRKTGTMINVPLYGLAAWVKTF